MLAKLFFIRVNKTTMDLNPPGPTTAVITPGDSLLYSMPRQCPMMEGHGLRQSCS